MSKVVLPRTPDRIRSLLHTQPGIAEAEPSRLSLTSGLAVDYHNERLYWADAKLSVIGSIRLNGTDPIVAADSKRGQEGGSVGPSPATRPPTLSTEPRDLTSLPPSFSSRPHRPFVHSSSIKLCKVSRGRRTWHMGGEKTEVSCDP